MKLFAVVLLTGLAILGQPAYTIPKPMQPLRMLEGEWHASGSWMEFRFEANNTRMIARVRPENGGSGWHAIMTISLRGGVVTAEAPGLSGPPVHYTLTESGAGQLVFSEDSPAGGEPWRIVYVRDAHSDQIRYLFIKGSKVIDRQLLTGRAQLRPLTE
jgi:hypothetical protein